MTELVLLINKTRKRLVTSLTTWTQLTKTTKIMWDGAKEFCAKMFLLQSVRTALSFVMQ